MNINTKNIISVSYNNNLFEIIKTTLREIENDDKLNYIKDNLNKKLTQLSNKIKSQNNIIEKEVSITNKTIIKNLSYLTEGFTGRDIRNITKILFKHIVNKDYIKSNNKLNNTNNKISGNIYKILTRILFLKDLFNKEKEGFIKKVYFKKNKKNIQKRLSNYNEDEYLSKYEKFFSSLTNDDILTLNIIEDKISFDEMEELFFLKDKNILDNLCDWNNQIGASINIEFLNNVFDKLIVNFQTFNKIIILDYLLNNLNIDNYFNAIEEYIIGKDKGMEVNNDILETIAIHELGHSVNGHLGGKNVIKVAIGAKNMSLGQTFSIEKEEKLLKKKKDFEKEIIELLGGRAAEKIIKGDYTTGASNDYERATKIAIQFFLNNMEYKSDKHGLLKIGLLLNPNDNGMKDYMNGYIKDKAVEYAKIMIEELEKEAEQNIKNNLNLIKEYSIYLLKNKILSGKDLESFLNKIK